MSQELPKPHAPALFDHDECERWLSTARRQLDTARALTSGAFHESAVLHAEQAAQCALKGLLHAVGAVREARGLRSWISRPPARSEPPWTCPMVSEPRSGSSPRSTSRHATPMPCRGGTPADHYGTEAAERAVATATRVLESVEAHLGALGNDADLEPDRDDG